jgi:hypothetical protein
MERVPPKPLKGAHRHLEAQHLDERLSHRIELPKQTPVFGTAQPPRGLSGMVRNAAYRIPQHQTKRWLLLLAADRIDVLGHRLAKLGIPVLVGGLATAGTLLFRRVLRD